MQVFEQMVRIPVGPEEATGTPEVVGTTLSGLGVDDGAPGFRHVVCGEVVPGRLAVGEP